MKNEARIYDGEKTVSGGKTGQLHAKTTKSEHFFTPYMKINSKWIKDPNVRLETIKLLEESIGNTLFDIYLSGIFLNLSSQARETKSKINET